MIRLADLVNRRLDHPLGRPPLAAHPHPQHPWVPLSLRELALGGKLPLNRANPQPSRPDISRFKAKGMPLGQMILPEGTACLLEDFDRFAVGDGCTHPRPVAAALAPSKGNAQHIHPR